MDISAPSALACVTCRARHLKCDAKAPTCGRCEAQGAICKYVRSKRGLYKSRTRSYHSQQEPQKPWLTNEHAIGTAQPKDLEISRQRSILDDLDFSAIDSDQLQLLHDNLQAAQRPLEARVYDLPREGLVSLVNLQCGDHQVVSIQDSTFIDLFYTHVHPAHSFIAPKLLLRQKPSLLPRHLLMAMAFAGSHFSSAASPVGIRDNAAQILNGYSSDDGFSVQALLLLALTFHGRFEEQECLQALHKAVDLALRLRMFDETYALSNSFGNSIIAESWRRTFWELVVADILIPTFHHGDYESRLQNLEPNVALPCEEYKYNLCQNDYAVRTQEQFLKRHFQEDEYEYSSFAYKIEAARLLHLVQNSTKATERHYPQTLSISLANFFLSLPSSKQGLMKSYGSVDEVLFSAHVIADIASLLFYRFRADFGIAHDRQPSQCTAAATPTKIACSSPQDTSKALQAADSLSDTVAAHLAMRKHSLFLTCAIALSSSIHLPAYLTPAYASERHNIKERLQLCITALQRIGEVWRIAQIVKAQISKYAREVISHSGSSLPPAPLQLGPEEFQEPSMASDDTWLDRLSDPGLFASPMD